MSTPPAFTSGSVLTASQLNLVALWGCLPTSVTNGTVSNDTITFSGVSSLTVNGVFGSDSSNYVIVARMYTTNADSYLQLTSGGSPATSNYNYSVMQAYAGAGVSVSRTSGASQFVFTSNTNGAVYGTAIADLFSPFASDATGIQINHTRTDGNYATPASYIFAGNHSTLSGYDGFKLNVGSGTMTGTLQVYAKRN